MDYLDFELEIGAGSGREYPVAVVNSPAGQVHETMHFPFDELALENRLLALQNALLRSGGKHRLMLSPEERTVQDFGQTLFRSLFTRQVYSLYEKSRLLAGDQDKGVRLKLRIQSPGLAALPWEFLYDPNQGDYLCLSMGTPVIRYLALPQPPRPLIVTPPLSILGLIASPKDLLGLDVKREQQRVEKALEVLLACGHVKLTWLKGHTWEDLQQAMYQPHPWHIFHFIGHGEFSSNLEEGLLALEDENGQAKYLSATQVGRLLADHHPLRLVLLNSCEGARGSENDIFSGTASILVRRGIPAVLAMQYEITDQAAIEFSRAFYKALANGLPIDMAVTEARKAVSIAVTNTLEWGTPVLYMHSPDGVLFHLEPAESATILPSLGELITSPKVPPEEAPASTSTISSTKAIPTRDETVVEPAPIKEKVEAFTLLRTLTAHTGRVEAVAISPDGQFIVSGGSDQTVRVWDLQTGNLLRTLTGHPSWASAVWAVAISPDGRFIVSGGGDKTVKVWDLQTGNLLRTLTGHTGGWLSEGVRAVAISPDGQFIVSGGGDQTVKVWDLQTGNLLRTLTALTNWVNAVAISPDGQFIVSGDCDKIVKVWDLQTGNLLRTLTAHTSMVNAVAINPDGQFIVSGGADDKMMIYRTK